MELYGRDPVTRAIDLLHLGRDRVICAYVAGGLIVDPGPSSCVETLLDGLGGVTPRGLLLTHIHLDHAGASGVLCRRFPDLVVYVHETGAPHLVDPSKLLASATRLHGDDMDELWGEVAPVPSHRIRALSGGERVEGFQVAYTPGHASHHVCYFHEDSGDAYVGDTAGVRIPPYEHTVAPTPPPDIDVEAWLDSLHKIAAWNPQSLQLSTLGRRGLGPPGRRGAVHRPPRGRAARSYGSRHDGGLRAGRAARPALPRPRPLLAEAGRMNETIELPRVDEPGTGLDDNWRVIVLNDDHNTFEGVAAALSRILPGVSYDQGMAMANKIHNTGRAIVWTGAREPAELYWEQLKDAGLTMAPLEQG
jgi:glyoxylase-like metal-dependent hydrolase (beta-lactamase superfamily II)/ATP-dependent Clp protease adapter protein ClpS